ncbi:DUF2889 domain-containing protein [Nisaea acidiphila]|uniref:DUF2889 domain-containing protein n=1 Tax=Nisaea acidiphila TaxID=1862145 RepID=A0A9J7AX28_9PROT|nr:DUF2889 domain-containing protein [Nisaea acidiphila]UUX51678.1 DUF2889 domain-containing protein [Nisaea acidiphila]
MPLSDPAARRKVHTRRVTCEGFRRDDGLLDIEGHITDVKTYEVPNKFRGGIKPGEPIHDMSIRLTVDEDLTIHRVEAVTDAGPFGICPAITGNFQRLKGVRIGPGWRKKVLAALGGAEGCTHLVELLWPMATTAYQTLYGERSRLRRERGEEEPEHKGTPPLLNSCHAFGETSPVVKEIWPDFYKEPA